MNEWAKNMFEQWFTALLGVDATHEAGLQGINVFLPWLHSSRVIFLANRSGCRVPRDGQGCLPGHAN